jgi:hypothetical protein
VAAIAALSLTTSYVQPARAALMADPEALYAQMKQAYDTGTTQGWSFSNQLAYFSTILNAGRAYSLQHPDSPQFGELALLTVQIGSGVRYNPLTNHDAAAWWVRQAAIWVQKNATDMTTLQAANDLLLQANSEDDPEALTRYADQDATANLQVYPRDVDAQMMQLEADWRGWLITGDAHWRSLAFQRAARADFPVANLPTTYGNAFVTETRSAKAGVSGFTPEDRANATAFLARYDALDPMRTIAVVKGIPHSAMLTMLAPADEYFGPFGYSILGIENQLKHVNFMLDYNYGDRESAETLSIVQAVLDMQKVYPRDRDMAKLLYSCITTLQRMTTPDAKAAAVKLRGLLTVEYQDSPEAQKVLTAAS